MSKATSEDAAFDSVAAARFADSAGCESNKPDYRELDLGSPISPLMIRGGNGVPTTSSSCSSSGSFTKQPRSGTLTKQNSGELSDASETSSVPTDTLQSPMRRGHRRSASAGAPLIYSTKSPAKANTSASSVKPSSNVFLSGNICPSGKISKPSITTSTTSRSTTLGTGTGNYGHGNVIRGGATEKGNANSVEISIMRHGIASSNPDEVKRAGNELYRRGSFEDALSLYDRAISISPENPSFRSNRAAALSALGRLDEAVRECEEAVRLDPNYIRAHQRLGSLYLRLGFVENARNHLCLPGQQPDYSELQKLQSVEKNIKGCFEARRKGDWKSAMRESDAAIATAADSSPQLVACKAEALLKLHRLQDAENTISAIAKSENNSIFCSQSKFCGMVAEAYVLYVRSQVEMAFGRFDNAIATAERAAILDQTSAEIVILLSNVKSVAKARARGNDLFGSGRYSEACSAYGEGLKYDKYNSVLYCNRAVCWSKLGLWEKSVEDCNQALSIQPKYTKALLRRAASNGKLGRWAESVRDYEVLRKERPGDTDVLESLHRAQASLKNSSGEELHSSMWWNLKQEAESLRSVVNREHGIEHCTGLGLLSNNIVQTVTYIVSSASSSIVSSQERATS